MKEIWKIIPLFPSYSVSTLGKVKRNDTGKLLNYDTSNKGYLKLHALTESE